MENINYSLLHANDLQFIDSLDTDNGTNIHTNEHEISKILRGVLVHQPNMNTMAHFVKLFNELGNTALLTYQKLRIDLFYAILAHLTKIAYPGFMSGSIPTYITAELFTEKNISWIVQQGCMYVSMNDLTFLDVMSMVHLVNKCIGIRITDVIVHSNESYIRDAIYELSNAETIDFRILYRNTCYWRCLLDSMADSVIENATSLEDYPEETRIRMDYLLNTHMAYYVLLVKTCYQAEQEYYQVIKELIAPFTSAESVPNTLRRQVRERILLSTIIQSSIKRLVRTNIFIQAVQWMAKRWIETKTLNSDPYMDLDYSMQISAITNLYQVIHRIRSPVYTEIEPYTNNLYKEEDCVVLNAIGSSTDEDTIQFREAYNIAYSISDIWNVIFDTSSNFNIHMKCQSALSIIHIVWINIAKHVSDKPRLYKNMFNTYILLENYNEHTGFQEQIDFRNFIVAFLVSCQWTTPSDIIQQVNAEVALTTDTVIDEYEDSDDDSYVDGGGALDENDSDATETDRDGESDDLEERVCDQDTDTDCNETEDDESDTSDNKVVVTTTTANMDNIFSWLESLHESSMYEGLQFIVMSNAHIVRLIDMYDKTIHKYRNAESRINTISTTLYTTMLNTLFEKLSAIVRYIDIHVLILDTMTQFLCNSDTFTRNILDSERSSFFRWWINATIDTVISISKMSQLENSKDWYYEKLIESEEYKTILQHLWKSLISIVNTVRCIFTSIQFYNYSIEEQVSNPESQTSEQSSEQPSELYQFVHSDIQDWFEIIDQTTKTYERYVCNGQRDVLLNQCITEIHDIYTKYEPKFTESVPSEFLDSILFTEIYHPIELPDTRTLVDDWSILKHVLIEQTNPYTRKTLTLHTLLEYQKEDDVKGRIREYMERWTDWRSKHLKLPSDKSG